MLYHQRIKEPTCCVTNLVAINMYKAILQRQTQDIVIKLFHDAKLQKNHEFITYSDFFQVHLQNN